MGVEVLFSARSAGKESAINAATIRDLEIAAKTNCRIGLLCHAGLCYDSRRTLKPINDAVSLYGFLNLQEVLLTNLAKPSTLSFALKMISGTAPKIVE
jgi:hypothetical protein